MAIIARYRDLPGAEVASATLEASGITNSLFDAETIGVNWAYSTALGWIKVHVAEADAEEARSVLDLADEIEWPAELSAAPAPDRCPFCGSEDLAYESGPRKTLALMSYASIPLWFWRSKIRCRSCEKARTVDLRVRPELVLGSLISAVGLAVVIAILMLVGGFLASTLREISR